MIIEIDNIIVIPSHQLDFIDLILIIEGYKVENVIIGIRELSAKLT